MCGCVNWFLLLVVASGKNLLSAHNFLLLCQIARTPLASGHATLLKNRPRGREVGYGGGGALAIPKE